jgi:two-component system response regulator HydG
VSPRVVGRAREADLVLRDARVSRQHVRALEVEGEARIEVCEGAREVLVNGVPRTEATVHPGDQLVIGDTPLAVMLASEGPGSERALAAAKTEVRVLMTGVAADVAGLASVMDLVESLDVCADEAAMEEALGAWGKRALSATEAALSDGDDDDPLGAPDAASPALVERPGLLPDTTLLSAPLDAAPSAWLTFTCGVAEAHVTGTMRRLAVVAARIASVALGRMRRLRQAEEEREAFRRASLGSARSFLGDCPAALEVSRLLPRLAASDALVLVEGETGVGKTFLARLIHEQSARAKEPLRVINCAAIPDTLIESELFGHERGAFTGATTARAGALEAAGRGTLLLDEIGELPLPSQAKLLRVLEEKRFERLGSNRPLRLEARVIVATNRDLAAMVEEGTFRKDLFYRVAVVKLRVPPLRDRGEDLVLLAERILADLAPQAGRRVLGFSPAAIDAIRRYGWPGNVRELRNAIERALVVGEGERIEPRDLPETVHGAAPVQPDDESLVRLPAKIDWLEARAIEAALRATGGNQRQAAALLGIGRNTLARKLRGDKASEAEKD